MRSSQQALLHALPGDWGTAPLADIASIHSGSTPKREVAAYWGGDIPWVTPGELTGLGAKYLTDTAERITAAGLASCSATLVPPNALLVTTRATLGSVALAAMHVATNQGFRSLVFSDRADPNFYYHLAPLLVSELTRRASGTTFLEISGREFASVEVPLPPLAEQRRIAEVLDTLDEAIRGTEQVIAKLQQMKQGLLHDLLTRGLDENGELRDPARHPDQFKVTPLGPLPVDWKLHRLGDVIARFGGMIQTGPFGSQLHASDYVASGIPVVMPQDITDTGITTSQIAMIAERKAIELGRHRVRVNDALFSRRGDLSRCWAITENERGWLCGTGCLLVRAPESVVTASWLTRVYRHDLGQRQVLGRAVGSTMVNLNGTILAALTLPVPPVQEQAELTRRMESTEARIAAEARTLNKLTTLRQGLADDLLTGRVRVPIAEEATP